MHNGREVYAVTEIISFIVVVMVSISAISVIIFWGVPFMENEKSSVRVDSAVTQFETINGVIQQVAAEGVNGSEMVDFVTDAGQVNVDFRGDRFVVYYSLISGFDFNISGLEDGNYEFNFDLPAPSSWLDHVDIYYLNNGSEDPDEDATSNQVDAVYPLVDAVRIDVENSSDDLMGRIWLFDSGSIIYGLSSSSGSYVVKAENGGVILVQNNNGYVVDDPNINQKKDSLSLWMIQLKPTGAIGGAGLGRYTFLIKSNTSFIRENKNSIYHGLKMQIYGDSADYWIDYFKNEHGFKGEDPLFLSDDIKLSLVHVVCDVDLMEG